MGIHESPDQPRGRTHRHRRRRPRRQHGPRGVASGGCSPRSRATAWRWSIAATWPGRPTPGSRRSTVTATCPKWCSGAARCTKRCTPSSAVAPADPAGRRPLPGDRLDQRGCAPLPRSRQEAARDVARRARRLQHRPAHAERQHPRHAGGLPVRPGPAELIEIGGKVPAMNPKHDPPDRHPQRRPRREEAGAPVRLRSVRHALHRRDGHAPGDGTGAGTIDANTHLHVSFDVDFLDPEIAPGVDTTVPGGPTYREAQLCMEMIADTGALASLDVMELNPASTCATRLPSWRST